MGDRRRRSPDHGHRSCAGHPQALRAYRLIDGGLRSHRVERSVCTAGARGTGRRADTCRSAERQRRRNCPRPSDRRDRHADSGDAPLRDAPAQRAPRPRHAMRQRRPRHGAGDRTAMRVAVIPGDGIGKEVIAEAVKVLRAVAEIDGRTLDLVTLPWSADHYLATGETLPPDGYAMLRDEFDAILLGALGDPRVP